VAPAMKRRLVRRQLIAFKEGRGFGGPENYFDNESDSSIIAAGNVA